MDTSRSVISEPIAKRAPRTIELRGVEVHNLKKIDLDLAHRKLIVLCGLSGSGKSSLAFDTLYAEGQRRYIETFSAYTRQFLERLEKPAAERIDGIPPAVAVAADTHVRSTRSTVGTATETNDYLRLLFAKVGRIECRGCGHEVRRDDPQSIAAWLRTLQAGIRFMVTFPAAVRGAADGDRDGQLDQRILAAEHSAALREDGFGRVIAGGRTVGLDDLTTALDHLAAADGAWDVVADRLSTGGDSDKRVIDSLEMAFRKGNRRAALLFSAEPRSARDSVVRGAQVAIDGQTWWRTAWSARVACEDCGIEYAELEPRLFSFNSPMGACAECEGFGNIMDVDMDLVVPDRNRTLRDGAVAPWNSPAYRHELDELLALAHDFGIPVDVPVRKLSAEQWDVVRHGVRERNFGGLDGFFAWLERRKYKMHIRVFLSRWRSYRPCPACGGARLRPEALAVRVGGLNVAEVSQMKVSAAAEFFRRLALDADERIVGHMMLGQVCARLGYLEKVGLGYLTLDRPLRTLSGGESQRVALTSALGSSLVNMLYVLDEPSVGLHPHDTSRLVETMRELRDRGNTVVVVEHEESVIRAADEVVEIGPGAGERGGKVVFQGTPAEMEDAASNSLTGDYLAGRRGFSKPERRRAATHGWLRLTGARGHNLKNLSVEFPLGVLCVVTGVSGSGKSTLVVDTLYPALRRRMRKDADKPCDFDDVFGDGQLEDCTLVDQSPIGRSPRSNPVTYIKVFDEIRGLFAETVESKTRGYTASHFSFNAEQGRCHTCQGDGYLVIDMQFLADMYVKCPDCHGRRYRKEILDIRCRNRNIAEVLDMTVREAFLFFRGQTKIQARLKRLIDVGLDYLRLGQPANTLSGGEAQRLKLAGHMTAARRGRNLLILDEPTTGLHFSDVVQLLDCFDALLSTGHSLIVVEHNLQIIEAADYMIDLGPGAADEGGAIVAAGTPEQVTANPNSITGRYLKPVEASS